jgi:protein-S-isoprenylcysteine O-methyltransferase Ste14
MPVLSRSLILGYGVLCYLIFLGSFLYAIGFVGNLVVPKSIDSGPEVPLAEAVAVDLFFLSLFAVQHSVMARPAFKQWWTTFVPPPVERSTYVLFSSLLLGLLFWRWQPIPAVVWHVVPLAGRWLLDGVFWLGWLIAFSSTFLIDHFDLFGLRQVYLCAVGRPYRPIDFKTPGLYRFVRHPLMMGFLIAFWATPAMTGGHLLFAATTTAYILLALRFEERDLETIHRERYRAYRRQAGMLLPFARLKKPPQVPAEPDADQFPFR